MNNFAKIFALLLTTFISGSTYAQDTNPQELPPCNCGEGVLSEPLPIVNSTPTLVVLVPEEAVLEGSSTPPNAPSQEFLLNGIE